MSKIVWDQAGQRWLETGTDRGVLYPMKEDGTYDNGEAWNGLRSFEEQPEGAEPQEFWADNILYATLMSAEKFKYAIGCYTYPKVWEECNGFISPIPGVSLGQQSRRGFGFTCRTMLASDTAPDSNSNYLIHIIYNSTASPSSKSYETKNDSPSAVELSYDCTAKPVNVTGYKPTSCITIDTRTLSTEKLTLIENKLYGTDETEPTLLSPDAILALLADSSAATYTEATVTSSSTPMASGWYVKEGNLYVLTTDTTPVVIGQDTSGNDVYKTYYVKD